MAALYLLMTIPLFCYHAIKSRNLINPNVYMYGLWSLIVGLNVLHLFGIKGVSDDAYIMVFAGTFSYFLGEVLALSTKTIKLVAPNKRGVESRPTRFTMNYKIIYVLAGATIALMIIDTIIAAQYLMRGWSFTQVRMWLTETYENATNPLFSRRSYAEQVFRVIVIAPFRMALGPLCAIDFFFGERNKKVFWITVIIQGLGVISGGGARLGIVNLGLSFLMAFSMFKRKNNTVNRKEVSIKRRRMHRLIVLGIVLVGIITTQRTSSRIYEEAYFYFALCLPLLSIWIPEIQATPHTYGMVSLFGLLRIPFLILEKLGLYSPEVYIKSYNYIVQANSFRSISSGTRIANSFVTPYYYLYLDAGYIGIVLGMIIIGYFANKCYRNVLNAYDYKAMYLLMLVDIGIFYTFIRLELVATNYFLALIATPLFFERKIYQENKFLYS